MTLDKEIAAAGGEHLPLLDAGRELTTRSGLSLYLRSAQLSDEAVLAEFFSHVTEDDLRFRFLSAIRKVGHSQLATLTHVNHRRSENFLAFDPVSGSLLASAMLAMDDDLARAEVAIVIRSDHKNMGIGWRLLEHAAEQAAAMGVGMLQAIESRENGSAISLEREMGFTARAYPGDGSLVLLEKSLGGAGTELAERSAA